MLFAIDINFLPSATTKLSVWPRFLFFALGLLTSCNSPKPAHSQDAMIKLLQANEMLLRQEGEHFSGPGWEKLQQDVHQSKIILVGEDHGTAQIPAFTTALARVIKPAFYVAEIDPYQAQDLTTLASHTDLPKAFERQHPMGLSFYSWAEEFELARYLHTTGAQILGIDQINCFSISRFYTKLATQVTNKTAQKYLMQRASIYQAHDRIVMGSDPGQLSMITQSPALLDSLTTMVKKENPTAQRMVEQYITSVHIYQKQSTQERVNLMKRTLMLDLASTNFGFFTNQPLPKMLFKLGAFHTGRGASISGGTFDVGNLAVNLADIHDSQSLHILIAGRRGKKNDGFDPIDFSKNQVSYSNSEEAIIRPFPMPLENSAWQVFDLRPLRQALQDEKIKVTNQELATIALGYDYAVIIPETTASHNY